MDKKKTNNPHSAIFLLLIMGILMGILMGAIAACSSSSPAEVPLTEEDPPLPVVKLVENPWSASAINNAIARIILEEHLGSPVEIVALDEQAQWEALASGEAHASLEVWSSGHQDNIQKYIEQEKSVAYGGFLGPIGQIGWFMPRYVLEEHPELATWEGFRDPEKAAIFRTAESGEKGQFLAGDPSWVQYDRDIIRNLDLHLEVVVAGSEEAIVETLAAAYSQREPVLFYFWMPHHIFGQYDLVEVSLPPHTMDCYELAAEGGVDCAYPDDSLIKIFWSDFETYAPEAYRVLQTFNYWTGDQNELLVKVDVEGQTPEMAARHWLETNETSWRRWLPAGQR